MTEHRTEGPRGAPAPAAGTPTIRRAVASDRDALYDICLRTGDAGSDASGLVSRPELLGEVYVGPYLARELDTCLVLDHGGPVGYVLGATDTGAFNAWAAREWWPRLRARYPRPEVDADPGPAHMDPWLLREMWSPSLTPADIVRVYPAHLHIDLLPQVQGGGWGALLLTELFAALAERGAGGVHLGVAEHNERAVGFYRRMGFDVVETGPGALIMARPLTGCLDRPR